MKVLLVQPPKAAITIGGDDAFVYEPLALEYLGAAVAGDCEVRILDMRFGGGLGDVLAEYRPAVVGLTAYTAHVNVVRGLAREVKAFDPRARIVVGGHHATVMPDDFISADIDYVVTGEGISPFRELVRRIESGLNPEGIPGVGCVAGERLLRTAPAPPEPLDCFPFPARRLTAAYRTRYYSEWMRPLASIRTSKGCPFRCRFCAQWKIAGGRYFRRDPEKVVEELAGIEEPFVFFADDESLVDAPRMKTLAERIRASGIRKKYFLYGRPDTIARHPELLRAWRDIGLERVFVGFEFFRDADLASIRKECSSDENEKAAAILADLGLEVYASFIVRPDFGREDFAAYRSYCRKLKLRFASFSVLTPLPGTDLYESEKARMIAHDYEFFDFLHTLLPTALPLKDFYEELYGLYRHAIPAATQISLLGKLPWRDIPGALARGTRVLKQLRSAHLDYAGARPPV